MSDATEQQLKEILAHLRKIEQQHEDAEDSRRAVAERLVRLERDVGEIRMMATRWKGAIAGILGGGALVGYFLTSWESIIGFFVRLGGK